MTATVGTDRYRTVDAPVAGGTLRVGVWEPADGAADAPTVLLVHGVTASHRSWPLVTRHLRFSLPYRAIFSAGPSAATVERWSSGALATCATEPPAARTWAGTA